MVTKIASYVPFYNTGRTWILSSLIYGYLLLVSFGLTKSYEKQSLKERFGFQRKYWLMMFISICVGVVILYYFNKIYNINVINTSFFAPFTEEVFFRGYILGHLLDYTLRNCEEQIASGLMSVYCVNKSTE